MSTSHFAKRSRTCSSANACRRRFEPLRSTAGTSRKKAPRGARLFFQNPSCLPAVGARSGLVEGRSARRCIDVRIAGRIHGRVRIAHRAGFDLSDGRSRRVSSRRRGARASGRRCATGCASAAACSGCTSRAGGLRHRKRTRERQRARQCQCCKFHGCFPCCLVKGKPGNWACVPSPLDECGTEFRKTIWRASAESSCAKGSRCDPSRRNWFGRLSRPRPASGNLVPHRVRAPAPEAER